MGNRFFKKIRSAFGSEGERPSQAAQPSASEYVEWLPLYMLRTSQTELTISSSRPLPGDGEDDPALIPPCLPEQEMVINRLKVLCGLNPFRFSEPTDGSFETTHANHTLRFAVQFTDGDQRDICTLNLSIRAQA